MKGNYLVSIWVEELSKELGPLNEIKDLKFVKDSALYTCDSFEFVANGMIKFNNLIEEKKDGGTFIEKWVQASAVIFIVGQGVHKNQKTLFKEAHNVLLSEVSTASMLNTSTEGTQ